MSTKSTNTDLTARLLDPETFETTMADTYTPHKMLPEDWRLVKPFITAIRELHRSLDAIARTVYPESPASTTFPPLGILHRVIALREDNRALHARLRTAQCDDPECDGTDAAHPAWWRGSDQGCDATVAQLEKVLATGEAGNYGSTALTAALRKVAGLISALATAKAEGAAEAYEAEARCCTEQAVRARSTYVDPEPGRMFERRAVEARDRGAAIRKSIEAKEGK